MNAIKGQSWSQCDPDIKAFVEKISDTLTAQLGGNLVGIYLHGSLAMGSYYRPKSDIDILVVIDKALSPDQRKELLLLVADLSDTRPTTGDIELSIIRDKSLKNFTHPLPYEIHFSSDWKNRIRQNEVDYAGEATDSDLAAHCMVTQKRGMCLKGEPISKVFTSVPWQYYEDAVLDDFKWITDGENILESPFYAVLNSCRTLQLLSNRNLQPVLSKVEGAEWALIHLPVDYHPVIQKALSIYQSSDPVTPETRRTGGKEWNKDELLKFRDLVYTQASVMQSQNEQQKLSHG